MKVRYVLLLTGFCFCTNLYADESFSEKTRSESSASAVKRTRGLFGTLNYLLNDLDTNYVSPNRYKFTLMLENSIWHENYHISSQGRSMDFTPNTSYKLGPYIGWSFIFLGWTIDIGTLLNQSKSDNRTEFSLNLYSSIIGGDLFFRKSDNSFRLHNLEGFGEPLREFDANVHGFSVDIKGVNVYYVFNHRRFSYPAAYSQSTNQRRSAGSLIAGFSYSNHKLELRDDRLPSSIRDSLAGKPLDFNEVNYSGYSISFGYAYNWVFAKNCLLNVSFSPALAFKKSHLENDTEALPIHRKFNLDFIARAAVTWNNGKYYVGASWVYNGYDYRVHNFDLQNGFGIARCYAGFNFGTKKKYKKK